LPFAFCFLKLDFPLRPPRPLRFWFDFLENYFNYFTEIEERFQKRRGSALLLSTLDWALIETWKDAGIPLEAALRGIDETFDKYERRPSRSKKVNSLAYCAQEVLSAAEEMKEAAVGTAPAKPADSGALRLDDVREFLRRNAETIAKLPIAGAKTAAENLNAAIGEFSGPSPDMEDLERRLTVMEEKLFAALFASTSDDELLQVRREADAAMAPYRSKMPSSQIEQLQKQFVHKRLLEKHAVPRLSLFYM
jgi:hypothetical protein